MTPKNLHAILVGLMLSSLGCGDDTSTAPLDAADAADVFDVFDADTRVPLDGLLDTTQDARDGDAPAEVDSEVDGQACTPCEGDCPCPCGDGVLDAAAGETCEAPFGPCCDPATCTFMPAQTSCGASADACLVRACDTVGTCQTAPAPDGRACDASGMCVEGACASPAEPVQWVPRTLPNFVAEQPHRWDAFPLQVRFDGPNGESLTVDGYWAGGSDWQVRLAAPSPGVWTWTAASADPGLSGTGSFEVRAPTAAEIAANANLRGHLRTRGQAFEYADGSALFLLGDTFWSFNATTTYRALDLDSPPNRVDIARPLAALDGGFYAWLDDRVSKGFNAVLVSWLSGHARAGDTMNEGGFMWDTAMPPQEPIVKWAEMNPAYYGPLDTRVAAIFDRGVVILGFPTRFVEEPAIAVDEAVNLTRYLVARYGAYNVVWGVTGAYHEACAAYGDPDFCDNDFEGVRELGRWLGGSDDVSPTRLGFDPYEHPISVHPDGLDPGLPDVNHQTSRRFDGTDWLDHHWINSAAETDKIVYRVAELREMIGGGLPSGFPVVLSEACHEGAVCRQTARDQGSGTERDAAIARRQAWTATFAGAAAYVYGAQGVADGTDDTALQAAGATDVGYVRALVETAGWPQLSPDSCVEVQTNGTWAAPGLEYPPNVAQQVLDYTYAPRCLAGATHLIYIPAGNEQASLRATHLESRTYTARWFDPRTGTNSVIDGGAPINLDLNDQHPIPARPAPANDDWVFVLE